MQSWLKIAENSDFSLHNIPLGIFSTADKSPRPCTRIGDTVVDLFALQALGYFDDVLNDDDFNAVFETEILNPLFDLHKNRLSDLRLRIQSLFTIQNAALQENIEHRDIVLHNASEVKMHLPIRINNYTDFYSSQEHAYNVGCMFRDPNNALLPNWKHIPIGYHGRASSITVSGTDVIRPKGQFKLPNAEVPIFGATRQLDFELEMAFITRGGKPLGQSISTEEAEDYIVGLCLFNDWSARDIQAWEYVPLGPFLGKNFASTLSPWIILLDALQPFSCEAPAQDVEVLPYLKEKNRSTFDIDLKVFLKTENGEENLICNSNFKYLYWTIAQQLAHHTVNGCNVQCGDVMASGTISGNAENSYGSMLELCWKGTKPITLKDETNRTFINDSDTVIIRASCEKNGIRIGFGECEAKVLPAN